MAIHKLEFEMISAVEYPTLFYPDGEPRKELIDGAPEEAWYKVTRESDNVDLLLEQYDGLEILIESGHPIRNVTLYRAAEPDWVEVEP